MPAVFQLECVECGRAFPPVAERLVCDSCNAKQKSGEAVRGILELRYESFPNHFPTDLSLEGWKDWLPLESTPFGTGLVVGATPLHSVPRLRDYCGIPALWIKDDTRNPSASTKDRASWLVCQKAKEFGLDTVATASTGNAASALACMSAAFDLRCCLYVPQTAPIAKLSQMRAFGAELCLVDGDYDAAYEASMVACAKHGWYNRNTAWNPYTIEGKKTAALEILAQLYPNQPDTIILSSGDGVILHGVIRGLHDLKQAGLISSLPRVLAIQSTGSDALWKGWKANDPAAAQRKSANSVADSLNVNVPRDAYGAFGALKSCGGDMLCVSDEAILEALILMAKTTGIFAEPAGATALAGCLEALESGILSKEERVVLLVTGSGLKDPGAAQSIFPRTQSPNL